VSSLESIAARKQMLIERSNDQRNEIARVYYLWQARTDVARKTTRFLKNPIVLSAIGLLALKMPWRRTFKFSGWLWKGWKFLRIFQRMI
jgi:hypothetical protein